MCYIVSWVIWSLYLYLSVCDKRLKTCWIMRDVYGPGQVVLVESASNLLSFADILGDGPTSTVCLVPLCSTPCIFSLFLQGGNRYKTVSLSIHSRDYSFICSWQTVKKFSFNSAGTRSTKDYKGNQRLQNMALKLRRISKTCMMIWRPSYSVKSTQVGSENGNADVKWKLEEAKRYWPFPSRETSL